jgi:hypothetical protein
MKRATKKHRSNDERDGMRESDGGLFDRFELRGKWRLPNVPDDRVMAPSLIHLHNE